MKIGINHDVMKREIHHNDGVEIAPNPVVVVVYGGGE